MSPRRRHLAWTCEACGATKGTAVRDREPELPPDGWSARPVRCRDCVAAGRRPNPVEVRWAQREQVRAAVAAALRREPWRANNPIAAEFGVSQPYVAKLRAELEAGGAIPQVERTIGADGKARPARKKR